MIQVSGNPDNLIEQLKNCKKDFKVSSTSNSTMLEFDLSKYLYSDSHFSKKYLHYFQKLKKEVTKNIQEKNIIVPDYQKSKYFHFKEFEEVTQGEILEFKNCIELDINKAYYVALYNLGYISKDFFNLCIELPKKIRLALVGTLATTKSILFYEDGVIKDHEIIKNDKLRNVFFHCVKVVDECLYSFSYLAKESFIFYWVDGIYLKPYKDLKRHLKFIENKYNLQFSTDLKERVLILKTSEQCTNIGVFKDNKDYKIFSLPNIFIKV